MEYEKDFTLEHYREILCEIRRKFLTRKVSERLTVSEEQTLILRHDIDISPKAALDVAAVEAEIGIKATYYILLHSPFYNALDQDNIESFKKIIALGHEVGLHFDSHFWGIESDQQLEKYLIFEKSILDIYLDTHIQSFSFHLTNTFTKSCNKEMYAGLINAFPSFYQNDKVYCSDSYGIWRFKRLYDYICKTQEPLVQVLTHPEWWVFNAMSARDRIENHIRYSEQRLWKEAEQNYIYKPRI